MAKFKLNDGEILYVDNATLNMIFDTYDPIAIKNMLRRALERQRKAEAKLKNPPNCGSGVNPPRFHIDGCEVMRLAGLRPCYVDGKKALFHKWINKKDVIGYSPLKGGHNGGEVEFTLALVECVNGRVYEVQPQDVYFADSAGLFKQFAFDEEREAKT